MNRSPMKRSTTLKRGARLAARSDKRRRAYAGKDGRAAFVARFLAEHPHCQAGERIATAFLLVEWQCGLVSVDVHERLARSAGGNIVPLVREDGSLDETNFVSACRRCHDWIGDNPKQALALGLRVSRYPGRRPDEVTT